MIPKRTVDVEKGTRERHGSCNGCNDEGYRKVYNVSLNSLSFRLCLLCRDILLARLKNA